MSLHQKIMKSKVECLEIPNHSYNVSSPWTMYEYEGEKVEKKKRSYHGIIHFGKVALLAVLSASFSFYMVFLR